MAKIKKNQVKYRTIRTDFHTHERTAGIGAVGRDLLLQGILAGIAGLLERSVRSMARLAGVDEAAVNASLGELERRGLVRWWPELEVLWVIEAADEQAKGKAWESVRSAVATAPAAVRKAFSDRYPDKMVDGVPDAPSSDHRMGDSNQESGIRMQESGCRMQDVADATAISGIGPDEPEPSQPEPPTLETRPTIAPVAELNVEQALVEIQTRQLQVRARHTGSARERVAACTLNCRTPEGVANLDRELRDRGVNGVIDVLEWAWERIAVSDWSGKQREEERKRIVFAFGGSATYWGSLVAERADELARAEKAAARASPVAPEVYIPADDECETVFELPPALRRQVELDARSRELDAQERAGRA